MEGEKHNTEKRKETLRKREVTFRERDRKLGPLKPRKWDPYVSSLELYDEISYLAMKTLFEISLVLHGFQLYSREQLKLIPI